jgi:multicomponent Na+:H+ antiporter subunit E
MLIHATILTVASHRTPRARAEDVLRNLPPDTLTATPACPLCGAAVPARGLRPRILTSTDQPVWELAFTCPACGLTTAFNTQHLDAARLGSLGGSGWAAELRQARWLGEAAGIPQTRTATPRQFLAVLTISLLTWLVLTGSLAPMDLLWGLAVCLLVARVSYRLVAFDLPRWLLQPRRWLYFFDLLIEFTRQVILQNVSLSLRVLQPRLPIRPGIVAIPVRVRGDVNLTILGSLMTLTPDTVTIDIDEARGLMYVHWINVQTTDPHRARRLISRDLEDRLIRWLL